MPMELPRHSSHNSLLAWKRSPYARRTRGSKLLAWQPKELERCLAFILVVPANPMAGSFPTFFALKRIVLAEKSDWFPAISVQAGPAMWVLGVAVICGQYIIVWTVSFSFLVLSGCMTGLGTLW